MDFFKEKCFLIKIGIILHIFYYARMDAILHQLFLSCFLASFTKVTNQDKIVKLCCCLRCSMMKNILQLLSVYIVKLTKLK